MSHDISDLPPWAQDWARGRLRQHAARGLEVSREQWSGLRDWLASLPGQNPRMMGKLHKLGMDAALAASHRWHAALAARTQRLATTRAGFGGDPDAVEVVAAALLADGRGDWRWVRVTTPLGLDYEGAAMGHCVGQGGYDDVERTTIYSLRDGDNMPHCTVEWEQATRTVKQVQGRANLAVVAGYHMVVAQFINALEPRAVEHAYKFGHVDLDGRIVHWSKLEDDLVVQGDLDLARFDRLQALPKGLRVEGHLYLSGCPLLASLPTRLWVGKNFYVNDCPLLEALPCGLHVGGSVFAGRSGLRSWPGDAWIGGSIDIKACPIERLPAGMHVRGSLNVAETGLTELPPNLVVDSNLNAEDCIHLVTVSPGIRVASYLSLFWCTNLASLPQSMPGVGSLNVRACAQLERLPDDMKLDSLDVAACTGLEFLPAGLDLREYLNVEGCTALKCLPTGLRVGSHLYMRGCPLVTELPQDLWVGGEISAGEHLVVQGIPQQNQHIWRD